MKQGQVPALGFGGDRGMCEICDALAAGDGALALRALSREGVIVKRAAEHEVWFSHGGRWVVRGWATECVVCGWAVQELPSRFVASMRLLEHSAREHRSSPG